MINLFRAYQVVSDGNFVRYIQAKKDKYDDSEDIKVDKLMSDALNKYNIIVWKRDDPLVHSRQQQNSASNLHQGCTVCTRGNSMPTVTSALGSIHSRSPS
eukprot:1144195-Ditylum_brightwellii.AAC.1